MAEEQEYQTYHWRTVIRMEGVESEIDMEISERYPPPNPKTQSSFLREILKTMKSSHGVL